MGVTAASWLLAAGAMQSAAAQVAPCTVLRGTIKLAVGNKTIDACARTIQASQGMGSWGGNQMQIDRRGGVYLNGRFIGVAVNPGGTTGSLRDRCFRGDVTACEQWGVQSEAASRLMRQMYRPGWAER
jgi:hypothetical protein